MGLYGGFVVYPSYKFFPQPKYGFTVVLQDWNHDDDPETLSTHAKWRVRNKLMEPTQSIDGANFSRFHMHSAFINGKGRLYTRQYDRYNTPIFTHNGASVEVFEIEYSKTYRFRVVSAATLYPFRVYIQGHHVLTIRASDGFEIVTRVKEDSMEITVESFIIHPDERYDFTIIASNNPDTYLLVAESIEVLSKRNPPEYHAAEAIIQYKGAEPRYLKKDTNGQGHCTRKTPCTTFNAPTFIIRKQNTENASHMTKN